MPDSSDLGGSGMMLVGLERIMERLPGPGNHRPPCEQEPMAQWRIKD